MKSIIPILAISIFLFNSCKQKVSTEEIEKILEVKLPDCYTIIEEPKEYNVEAIEVEVLIFSEECFEDFLNEISRQIPNSYCGTAPTKEITLAFCTTDQSAIVTLNTETRVLQYEKLK